MIIDREVSTDTMLIKIVTFDQGNQYRMKRNYQILFDHIQFLGPAMVPDIQITESMIDRWNSTQQLECLMRAGYPPEIQSVTGSATVFIPTSL